MRTAAQRTTSSTYRRVAAVSTVACVVACAFVSLPQVACEPGTGADPGPVPVIQTVTANTVLPGRDDAGRPQSNCGFEGRRSVLAAQRGDREAGLIEWDDVRTGHVRYESIPQNVNDPNDSVAGTTSRVVSLPLEFPPILCENPGTYGFSLILVAQRGAHSQPARGSVILK